MNWGIILGYRMYIVCFTYDDSGVGSGIIRNREAFVGNAPNSQAAVFWSFGLPTVL